MANERVVVHVVAAVWGLSSASPFCVKLETWLRMAQIPFELQSLRGRARSATGKVPYIERADGSLLADSQRIIEMLGAERGIDLDAHLDAEQRATSHLLRKTIEESLYFAILWQRWAVDEHWSTVRENYFAELPYLLRNTVPNLIRNTVAKQLDAQGTGRRSPAEIYAIAEADVTAVATTLGDRDFCFDEPSSIDAVAYGFFAGILAAPINDRLKQAVESHDNLVQFCARMKARYFAEGLSS